MKDMKRTIFDEVIAAQFPKVRKTLVSGVSPHAYKDYHLPLGEI